MKVPHLILRDEKLYWNDVVLPCSWGRGGIKDVKREGDGATPTGKFPFRHLFYRADRLATPETQIPFQALDPQDGWCDDPQDPLYNQYVKRPYPARHEALWREDEVYDLILVVGHNDDPVVPGEGSAVFVHLCRPALTPTEGCVALKQEDLLDVLRTCTKDSCLVVEK